MRLHRRRLLSVPAFAAGLAFLLPALSVVSAQPPPPWVSGDVFVAIGNGQYKSF